MFWKKTVAIGLSPIFFQFQWPDIEDLLLFGHCLPLSAHPSLSVSFTSVISFSWFCILCCSHFPSPCFPPCSFLASGFLFPLHLPSLLFSCYILLPQLFRLVLHSFEFLVKRLYGFFLILNIDFSHVETDRCAKFQLPLAKNCNGEKITLNVSRRRRSLARWKWACTETQWWK